MPILLLLLFVPVLLIALMPLLLLQRYRLGTRRRQARPWLATFHLGMMAVSVVVFLVGAAIVAAWVPKALAGAAVGLAAGVGLGVAGLLLTRWEPTPASLHYTPNRWLVLAVTLMVSARVLYGLWRSWKVAESGVYGTEVVLAFGIPESLAVGGAVIGYAIVYAWGVRRRVVRWQHRALRTI